MFAHMEIKTLKKKPLQGKAMHKGNNVIQKFFKEKITKIANRYKEQLSLTPWGVGKNK